MAIVIPSDEVRNALLKAQEHTGVPYSLLAGVAYAESGFNPRPKDSKVGAKGLMQIMPANFAAHNVRDPYDPFQSAQAAAELLAGWKEKFETWEKALAAYVWGPVRVSSHPDPTTYPDKVKKYVNKVLSYAAMPIPGWTATPDIVETKWAKIAVVATLSISIPILAWVIFRG